MDGKFKKAETQRRELQRRRQIIAQNRSYVHFLPQINLFYYTNISKQDSNFIIVSKGKLSLIENKFTDKQDEGMNCLIYNFKIRWADSKAKRSYK